MTEKGQQDGQWQDGEGRGGKSGIALVKEDGEPHWTAEDRGQAGFGYAQEQAEEQSAAAAGDPGEEQSETLGIAGMKCWVGPRRFVVSSGSV